MWREELNTTDHSGNGIAKVCWYPVEDGASEVITGYYVYSLIDADEVVRYVGKGTGRRVDCHLGILALVAGAPAVRASKVHRRFAAEVRIGRRFRAAIVADQLSQAAAYALEARLIAKCRRETEGGTLWNVLAGGEGFQGIHRDDWVLVARQAEATKELSGSGLRAGAKAAATKALTGSARTDELILRARTRGQSKNGRLS